MVAPGAGIVLGGLSLNPDIMPLFAPWVSANFRLQLLQSLRDSPMKRRIQRLIALASRSMEIERVTRALGIVALRGELLLAQLEGAGDFECGHDPQKYGAGILRQFFAQLAPQSREVEFRAYDQRGHSRAALGARHGDPVHRDVEDIAAPGECRGNLRGRDVLTLPAERVADPIDEVIEPLLVAAHEVTGPVPRVARREDIAQHFAAARLGVGIAFEPCAAAAGAGRDPANGLARLAGLAGDTTTLRVADGHPGRGIRLHQGHRVAMGEKGRNPTDRADPSLAVVKRKGAFG